jgi:hypothetical protein
MAIPLIALRVFAQLAQAEARALERRLVLNNALRVVGSLRVEMIGLEDCMAAIDRFSERRIRAALATALTRTALGGRDDLRAEARTVFDAPRPYTVNAITSKSATAQSLTAEVLVRDDGPVAGYLMPQVTGGARPAKHFERLATAFGLPAGWVTAPGPGAQLDQYGNMRRAQLRDILSQLSRTPAQGAARAVRRTGRGSAKAVRYFVMPAGRQATPGVYGRRAGARDIELVLSFVPSATYRVRFPFHNLVRRSVERRWPVELRRSFDQAIARWNAKNGR